MRCPITNSDGLYKFRNFLSNLQRSGHLGRVAAATESATNVSSREKLPTLREAAVATTDVPYASYPWKNNSASWKFTVVTACALLTSDLLVLVTLRFTLNSTSAQWRLGTFSKRHTAMPLLSTAPAWRNALSLQHCRRSSRTVRVFAAAL